MDVEIRRASRQVCQVISTEMTAETAWVRAEAVNIDNVHLTVNVTGYWLPCVPLGTRDTAGTKADFFF